MGQSNSTLSVFLFKFIFTKICCNNNLCNQGGDVENVIEVNRRANMKEETKIEKRGKQEDQHIEVL